MRLVTFPGVLRPPSDAFMLADHLRHERLDERSRVLDLCAGSGILAVVAAQSGAGRVTAVDISRRAVIATRLNSRLNGVRVRTVRGDLFAAVPGERFDVIVSNPPYLVSASDRLPRRGARAGLGRGHVRSRVPGPDLRSSAASPESGRCPPDRSLVSVLGASDGGRTRPAGLRRANRDTPPRAAGSEDASSRGDAASPGPFGRGGGGGHRRGEGGLAW